MRGGGGRESPETSGCAGSSTRATSTSSSRSGARPGPAPRCTGSSRRTSPSTRSSPSPCAGPAARCPTAITCTGSAQDGPPGRPHGADPRPPHQVAPRLLCRSLPLLPSGGRQRGLALCRLHLDARRLRRHLRQLSLPRGPRCVQLLERQRKQGGPTKPGSGMYNTIQNVPPGLSDQLTLGISKRPQVSQLTFFLRIAFLLFPRSQASRLFSPQELEEGLGQGFYQKAREEAGGIAGKRRQILVRPRLGARGEGGVVTVITVILISRLLLLLRR